MRDKVTDTGRRGTTQPTRNETRADHVDQTRGGDDEVRRININRSKYTESGAV